MKYAVERSLDKDDLPQRPDVLQRLPGPAGLQGALQGQDPDKLGLKAIETPDDQTIVFHLSQAVRGFDYFAQLPATIPVPQAKDTGASTRSTWSPPARTSSRPTSWARASTLVRNPNWDQATDPNRKALPDRIEVALNVNADDIDNRLIAGDLDVDIAGTGVQPPPRAGSCRPGAEGERGQPATARSLVHLDQRRRRAARQHPLPQGGRVRRRPDRLPDRLRRPDRRRRDRDQPAAAVIPGYRRFDLYPSAGNTGDVAKAKEELQPVRPAQRLRHQHLPTGPSGPRRRPRPRRCSSPWPGRHQARRSSRTRRRLLQALRGQAGLREGQQPRPDDHGWGADWPDGFGFL